MIDQGSTVMRLNPLTHLFAVWRDPLATGHVETASVLFVLGCLAALSFACWLTLIQLRKAAFWI